jgi:hypothetical protein
VMKITFGVWQRRGYNAPMAKTDMHKLTLVVFMTLLTLSTVSMAHARNTIQTPQHAAAIAATQNLSPEAVAMRNAQGTWPGRPLCDDGGYRIRPCDLGGDHR